jgi:hypothetical protein
MQPGLSMDTNSMQNEVSVPLKEKLLEPSSNVLWANGGAAGGGEDRGLSCYGGAHVCKRVHGARDRGKMRLPLRQ